MERRSPRPSPRRLGPLRRALAAAVLGGALLLPPAGLDAQEAGRDPAAALAAAVEAVGTGDLEGAVGLLEPFRGREDAPEALLATLGALYLEMERPEEALAVLAPLAEREDAGAAVLYNAGRAALAAGEVARGEAFLERSVELESGTPAARELGLLRGVQKRYREAYRLLRPWALAHPEDVEARRAAALTAIQLRRPSEAEELLSGLTQSEPQTSLLWGRLLLLQGQPQAARAMLEPLVGPEGTAGPEVEADARRVLAETYLEIGESERAIELLDGRTVGDPVGSLTLARARYQSGEVEAALDTLRPYAARLPEVGLDPENPRFGLATSIAREYGRWLVNAGRHGEALPYLRLVTEADPEAKDSWKALGQALAATGEREAAREALGRFQELSRREGSESERVDRARLERRDPTARALRRAGELLAEGRPEEALETVRSEREIAPGDVRLPIVESRVLLVLERPEEALRTAQEAVTMAPGSADALYQRGAAYLALGRFGEARRDLERSLELEAGHLAAMNDLAVLLLLQGERAEARRLLERILELQPDDPQAARTLERLESGPGG